MQSKFPEILVNPDAPHMKYVQIEEGIYVGKHLIEKWPGSHHPKYTYEELNKRNFYEEKK